MDRMLLKMRQAMSLEDKIKFTQRRIHEWVDHFGIGYIYIYILLNYNNIIH